MMSKKASHKDSRHRLTSLNLFFLAVASLFRTLLIDAKIREFVSLAALSLNVRQLVELISKSSTAHQF